MLKSFRGGIHPNDSKSYTANKPIEIPPIPAKLVIPVRQHIGAPAGVIVQKGDDVKKGQLIARSEGFVSGQVHSSTSGKVIDIGDYPHSTFGKCLSVVIETDGVDEWLEGIPLNSPRDYNKMSKEEILKIIEENGIVGMGGATFPTHVKLTPPKEKKIDTLVINAAECEPYLTADNRAMIEYRDRIKNGINIVMKILGIDNCFIGIEDNKLEAIKSMQETFNNSNTKVIALETKYPQGAEKMLIKMLTKREVPSGALPMDVGVVVQNVGTCIAISDAVLSNIPLIERVTTVSGGAMKEPKNLLLKIGTLFEDAINYCGGFSKEPKKIVMGGPMMGFAQSSIDVPVVKGCSGILALSKEDLNFKQESPCIRCGRCVNACPMGLVPSMLSILGEKNFVEEAKNEYNLLDCIECGSCVFVCPAKRNIVQYIRYSKFQNIALATKK